MPDPRHCHVDGRALDAREGEELSPPASGDEILQHRRADDRPLTPAGMARWATICVMFLTAIVSVTVRFQDQGADISILKTRFEAHVSDAAENRARRDEEIKSLRDRLDSDDRHFSDIENQLTRATTILERIDKVVSNGKP